MNHFRAVMAGCFFAILILGAIRLTNHAEAQKDRPRPAVKPAVEVPKEGTLYVWHLPEQGLQTLLVLKVIDGSSFEAAYLVPVRIELDGATTTLEKLDALIGGRLVNASLRGTTAKGGRLADIHFGEPKKDDPKSPSGWLTDLLKKK